MATGSRHELGVGGKRGALSKRLASPDLAGLLADFSNITTKRQIQLPRFEAEFPQLLGTLEIRDRIVVEGPTALSSDVQPRMADAAPFVSKRSPP